MYARQKMPSLIRMILDDTTGAPPEEDVLKLDDGLERDYRRTQY